MKLIALPVPCQVSPALYYLLHCLNDRVLLVENFIRLGQPNRTHDCSISGVVIQAGEVDIAQQQQSLQNQVQTP